MCFYLSLQLMVRILQQCLLLHHHLVHQGRIITVSNYHNLVVRIQQRVDLAPDLHHLTYNSKVYYGHRGRKERQQCNRHQTLQRKRRKAVTWMRKAQHLNTTMMKSLMVCFSRRTRFQANFFF